MKKIGLLVIFAVCFIGTKAQKSYDFLKGEKEMDIVLDYSEAKLDKKQSTAFFTLKNMDEQDYEEKYKKRMLQIFVSNVNEYLPSDFIIVPDAQNTDYQLIIKVINVDGDGETTAKIIISKIDTNEVMANFSANGDGGRWGSFSNLSGDGMERLAKNVGKNVAKKMNFK